MATGKDEDFQLDEVVSTKEMAEALRASGAVDDLLAQIDTGEVALTGEGGLLPGLIKLALERGLAAELTDHLGYEKGDPAGRALPNARNGSSPKTVQTEAGPVPLDVPRDREGSFTPRLVPKGQRRIGGLDDMIISLYAGGMTVRDIQFHLQSTLGTEVSHETISKIVDEISEAVLSWQHRPLDALYPVIYLTRSWSRSKTAAIPATRLLTSPWASIWPGSSTSWASGSSRTKAPRFGLRSVLIWPIGVCATC